MLRVLVCSCLLAAGCAGPEASQSPQPPVVLFTDFGLKDDAVGSNERQCLVGGHGDATLPQTCRLEHPRGYNRPIV